MKWSTACPDWERRIVAGESLVPIRPLFPEVGADALRVFCSLQATDLPKKKNSRHPTLGEIVDQNILDLVEVLFGAEDPKTKQRLINRFMLLISKKNGKSLIAAGIMLTALIVGWRPNSEKLILAPTLKIANNSFTPAMNMVRADPELSRLLHIVENQRTIKHRLTHCELKVVAADSDTVGGIKAGEVLVEELWLFGKKAKSAAMLGEALGGIAAREEGFALFVTTHSDEPPAGVFKSELEYFREVRDGVVDDPKTLGLLYEWPRAMLESEAYLDPVNWRLTNPHIERIPSLRPFITSAIAKAQRGEGEDLQLVLAKHLNVEIGLRLRRDRWRGADYWEAAGDRTLTLEALLERCEVAVIGIDGGGLDDLYGLSVAGRERGTGLWLYWAHAWAWPDLLDRRKNIVSLLREFEDDGDLTICAEQDAGDIEARDAGAFMPQDIAEIIDIVAQVKDSGLLPEKNAIGVDAAGIPDLLDALATIGLESPAVVAVGQGWMLNGAIVGLARKLKFGGVVHSGSAMMAWCVSNAKEEVGRQSVSIAKNGTASAKVDPFMAVLNATKLLAENPVADGARKSFWEVA